MTAKELDQIHQKFFNKYEPVTYSSYNKAHKNRGTLLWNSQTKGAFHGNLKRTFNF